MTALTTLVVGCGSSHHYVATGGGNSPAPSSATIRVQQVLARAVPGAVTQQRFTGFDARGEAHFGPVLQDKAATVELKDVPLTVTLLQIEYLQGSTLVGIGSVPVTLKAGETFVVNDPPFQDVTAALQSLQVTPGSATIAKGTSQQFTARATFADGTTQPVTNSATWTSEDEDVATIDTAGLASAAGSGQTTITATQDGVSGTAALAVTASSVSGGPFAYVANFSSIVQAYTVDRADGALAPVSGGTASIGTQALSAAADPSGRFLYVTNSGAVSAFVINRANGSLSEVAGSPFAAGGGTPFSVAVDPSGRFVYVCSSGSNTVSIFAIDQASGALAAIDTVSSGGDFLRSVTVDPSGRFVFVANANSSTLSVFRVNQDSGALTPVPGGPFPSVGAAPNRVSVHPSGRFLYLTYGATVTSPGSVMTFTVDPSDGSLTAVGSPVPTGGNASFSLTVHPSGRFVYVGGDGLVSAFAVDPLTGSLTAVIGSPFPTGGISSTDVTTDPSGRTLYVANFESGTVSAFTIDPISGSLTALPESPFPTNGLPQSIVITR